MSLPQRLPIAAALEKEKGGAPMVFPPFCMPPSSGPSVFPNPLVFAPNFQAIYANLLQQQFLSNLAAQQQASPAMRSSDPSPSLSDRPSSGTETPIKKLQVDEFGSPLCPLCNEKLAESEMADHLEYERDRLRRSIDNLKERVGAEMSNLQEAQHRKRANELSRVRANQLKRLNLKRVTIGETPSTSSFRGQSEGLNSPDSKSISDQPTMRCSICSRESEYCIVSNSFENPRCQTCFDSFRSTPQPVLIPATIGGSPVDLRLNASESSGSGELSPPTEKRIKIEE